MGRKLSKRGSRLWAISFNDSLDLWGDRMRDRRRGTVRDLRRENRAAVLWSLYLSQARSRLEVSAATGLSAASVTSVVRELLDEGMVIEAGQVDSDGGRPRALLGMNPE